MTHRLITNYAINYCNRALIVKVIVENVVTCFFGTRCSSLAWLFRFFMLFLAVIMFSFVSISQVIVEKAECFAVVKEKILSKMTHYVTALCTKLCSLSV